ncbi:MAG TPA: hypothetical protein VFG52_04600 [Xanthomonadales bacterium]|nr:hypothetical protein [Xanthomonadales bacterium]
MITSVPRWLLILLVALVLWAWRDWSQRPVEQAYGLRLAQAPKQQNLASAAPRQLGDFSLQPRARFDVEARVLSAERYRMGISADLAPLDLALGWGVMSDQAIVDQVKVSQGARWYILRWGAQPPAPEREIMRSSGNMHIIPANDSVRKQAFALRTGEFVKLTGYLVEAQGPGGFRWATSLSRDDTGDGACELFLVESVEVLQPPAGAG